MVEADPVIRAARNGYFALIIALFAVGMYQIIVAQGDALLVSTLWGLGVVVYFASKYYYEQQGPSTVDSENATAEGGEPE